jgi:hypothetical protein
VSTIKQAKAELYLAAVKAKYAVWVREMQTTPVLIWDWNGDKHPAVCWEEGPHDWAISSLDETYVGEYGYTCQPHPAVPGVSAEPYYSFVMMLYPED